MGRFEELPADYIARAERAFEFNLKMMTPNRDMPWVNDSWAVNVVRSMNEAFGLFPERTDFQWLATDGKEGTMPGITSLLLPYAGFAVMRSDWSRDANFLAFDGGPLGYAHVHQDKLNLVLHAYGRELLFDGGGGQYESSKWRRYSLETFSHSTVLVDGLPQRRDTRDRRANIATEPLPLVWRSDDGFDYAAAVYDEPYGSADNRPAIHRREVFFLKPDLFLVVDRLEPADAAAHGYEARWQVDSTGVVPGLTPGAFVSADAGLPNLAIVPLLVEGLAGVAVSAQEDPELLGWRVDRDGNRPATTVCHRRHGRGPQTLMTLLLPLRPEATCPVRAVRAAADGAVADIGDRSLTVRLLADGIEIRELNRDGEPLRLVRAVSE